MGISLEQREGVNLIRLAGAIDIGLAAELKTKLLETFGSGREVRIELSGATDLDLTAVQLLWAAKREANASGVGFDFEGKASERVLPALAIAGLENLAKTAEASMLAE